MDRFLTRTVNEDSTKEDEKEEATGGEAEEVVPEEIVEQMNDHDDENQPVAASAEATAEITESVSPDVDVANLGPISR